MSENIKNESIVTEGATPEEVAAQVAEQPKEGEVPVVASASTEGNAEPGAPDLAQMEDVPREEDPEERDLALFMDIVLQGKCQELWVLGNVISEGIERGDRDGKAPQTAGTVFQR